MIGYIVKGLFLLLKKYYEAFYKETQTFIEIYMSGKRKKEKAKSSTLGDEKTTSQNTALTMLSDLSSIAEIVYRNIATPGNSFYKLLVKSTKDKDDKDYLNKIIEESKQKLSQRASAKGKNDQSEEQQRCDITFREEVDFLQRELFSNYIDFDLKLIEENKNNKLNKIINDHDGDNLNESGNKIENENIIDEDQFVQADNNLENENNNITNTNKYNLSLNDITFLNRTYRTYLHEVEPKIRNMKYDRDMNIDIKETIKDSKEKNITSDNNKIFERHFQKLLLDKTMKEFQISLKEQEISNLIIDTFVEEIKPERYLEDEVKSVSKVNIEKFRDQPSTHRKSLDPNSLSNISLNEVFEGSTNKKLLTRQSLLLNKDINNIILEEDSNFNLNTLSYNFKNNIQTNFNLEFHEIGENEHEHIEANIINNNNINEEMLKYLNNNIPKHDKQQTIVLQDFINNSESFINIGREEATAVTFYSLLISSQANELNIQQKEPFGDIFLY
jgi:hypothetical protein